MFVTTNILFNVNLARHMRMLRMNILRELRRKKTLKRQQASSSSANGWLNTLFILEFINHYVL